MEVEWRLNGGTEIRVQVKGGGRGKYPYVLGQELHPQIPE